MAVSLVLAIGLWFTFGLRETYVVTVPVALRIVGVPAGFALSEPPPSSARATFRGEGWRLMLLARTTAVVSIDADAPAVDLERAVLASGLSANLTLQGVRPKTARLALDREARRRVPVRLVSDIRTAPSYGLLRAPRLLPDSVEVVGAASLLDRLTSWPTVALVLDDIQTPTTRTVALADPFQGLLTPSVRSTTVQVPIAEFTGGERLLEVRVVNVPAGIAAVRTEPAVLRARYRVPLTENDLYGRARDAPDFFAVVDYRDIARDTTSGTVTAAPRVPRGLDVRDVALSPSRVEYFIVRQAAP
ncbi:MAG TPA: hypothetical protein VF594_04915 [Rubricoccaceae bacterium]